MSTCYVRDCDRPAKRNGLCWGHLKRRQRKQVVAVELEERRRANSKYDSPQGRLLESAFSLNELGATDDYGWERARERLKKAALNLAKSLGWKPPD